MSFNDKLVEQNETIISTLKDLLKVRKDELEVRKKELEVLQGLLKIKKAKYPEIKWTCDVICWKINAFLYKNSLLFY